MKVRQIMSQHPVTAAPETTIDEVLSMLASHPVRHLPILEGEILVGMVNDRDLCRLSLTPLWEAGAINAMNDRLSAPIANVMTPEVLAVDPESDISDAAAIMAEMRLGALPVVDQLTGRFCGLLSYDDLLRAFSHHA